MDKPSFGQPARRGFDEAYHQAYQMASQRLRDTADLHILCYRSGATLETEAGRTVVRLNYFDQPCLVTMPDVEVMAVSGNPLTQRDKLIILHYLITADGSPLTGKPITFKELPEGAVYYPTYVKRTIKPLLDKFADRPKSLLAAAASLGGS